MDAEVRFLSADGEVVRLPRGDSRLADDLDGCPEGDGQPPRVGFGADELRAYARGRADRFRRCGPREAAACARVAMFLRDEPAAAAAARRIVASCGGRPDPAALGLDRALALEVAKAVPPELRVEVAGEADAAAADAELPWYRRSTVRLPRFRAGSSGGTAPVAAPVAAPARRGPDGALKVPDETQILRVVRDAGWRSVAVVARPFPRYPGCYGRAWALVDRGPGTDAEIASLSGERGGVVVDAWFEPALGGDLCALVVHAGDRERTEMEVELVRIAGGERRSEAIFRGDTARASPASGRIASAWDNPPTGMMVRTFRISMTKSDAGGARGNGAGVETSEVSEVWLPRANGWEYRFLEWNEGGDALLLISAVEGIRDRRSRFLVTVLGFSGEVPRVVATTEVPYEFLADSDVNVGRGPPGHWMVTAIAGPEPHGRTHVYKRPRASTSWIRLRLPHGIGMGRLAATSGRTRSFRSISGPPPSTLPGRRSSVPMLLRRRTCGKGVSTSSRSRAGHAPWGTSRGFRATPTCARRG